MAGSVFARVLRDQRWSLVGWSAVLGLPAVANVAVFPSIQGMSELTDFIRSLPPVIQAMIGDPEALTEPEGFLRLKFLSSWLPYLLSLFAILQASAAIAGERERGTIDLLLAQPIERWRVVTEKFAALGASLVLLCAVVATALVASATIVGVEVDRGWLVLSTFNTIPLVLVFGAGTLLASCNLRRARPALIAGVLALASTVFLETLAPIAGALRPLRPLSPLHHFDRSLPLGGELAPGPVLVLIALAAALLAASVWTFQRRDLSS